MVLGMSTENKNKEIYPVILAVPESASGLKGRDKVRYLSMHARRALKISAEKSSVVFSEPEKGEDGIPLPFNGYYWSLSHKSEFVGAVVAPSKAGIDIEKIKSVSNGLYKKIADDDEWNLKTSARETLFYRYWTSKEAVVKAAGTGFKDIPKCKVVRLPDDNSLVIAYYDAEWLIEHFFFNGHIASVVKNTFDVKWTVF